MSKKRTPNSEANDRKDEDYFHERMAGFEKALAEANAVSKVLDRRWVSERRGWAQWMHLKLCMLADSMTVLCEVEKRIASGRICTLDQTALMSLARSMVEAHVMLAYISEPDISDEEWTLRREVICLNDAQTRYRMFKGFKAADDGAAESASQKAAFIKQKRVLETDPAFARLPEDQRTRLLSGGQVYVAGLRAAARQAGWDVDEFDSIYAYLSSHAHGGPVSFIRMEDHGVDFRKPTGAQYAISGVALEYADHALKHATAITRRNFLEVFMGRC